MRTVIIVTIFTLIVQSAIYAIDNEQKYKLTTSATTIGYGKKAIIDPYLSSLKYSGWQVELNNKKRRFISVRNDRYSFTNRYYINGGISKNPIKSSSMLFFNINYLFGANYHFRPTNNLMVMVGSGVDIGGGGKYLSRNINNPFSLDVYSNINLTTDIAYRIKIWKLPISLSYSAEIPFAGVMFVPHQGSSYYEIGLLNNYQQTIHFSSLHNKQAVRENFNIDLTLKTVTIRLQTQHTHNIYTANGIVLKNNDLTFSIGAVIPFYSFVGKGATVPNNFLDSYK